MARSFAGVADYFTSAVPNQAGIVSLAAWVNVRDLSAARWVVSNYNAAGDVAQYDLSVQTNGGVEFLVQSSGGNYKLFDTPASLVSVGMWAHLCVVHDGVLNARIYVNGVSRVITPTVTGSPFVPTTGFGNTSIGRLGSFNGGYMDGRIADVAIWGGVQLTASDVSELWDGEDPAQIRPQNLVHFWRCWRAATHEEDQTVSAARMISAGAPGIAPHPPATYKQPRPRIFLVSSSAAPTGKFRRTLSALGTRTGSRQLHGAM